jgi:hypothetical protein
VPHRSCRASTSTPSPVGSASWTSSCLPARGPGRRTATCGTAFDNLANELTAVRTPLGDAWILTSDEPTFRAMPSPAAPLGYVPAPARACGGASRLSGSTEPIGHTSDCSTGGHAHWVCTSNQVRRPPPAPGRVPASSLAKLHTPCADRPCLAAVAPTRGVTEWFCVRYTHPVCLAGVVTARR